MKVDRLGKLFAQLATVVLAGMTCFFLGILCQVRAPVATEYSGTTSVLVCLVLTSFFFGLGWFTEDES